jgi:hypothetical protein
VAAANQACADRVLRDLTLLSGLQRYDAGSVRQVLDGAGLTDITAGTADVIVGGGCLPD